MYLRRRAACSTPLCDTSPSSATHAVRRPKQHHNSNSAIFMCLCSRMCHVPSTTTSDSENQAHASQWYASNAPTRKPSSRKLDVCFSTLPRRCQRWNSLRARLVLACTRQFTSYMNVPFARPVELRNPNHSEQAIHLQVQQLQAKHVLGPPDHGRTHPIEKVPWTC